MIEAAEHDVHLVAHAIRWMLIFGTVAGRTREQTVALMTRSVQDAKPALPRHEIERRLEVLREAAALAGLTGEEIEQITAPPPLH